MRENRKRAKERVLKAKKEFKKDDKNKTFRMLLGGIGASMLFSKANANST